MLASKFFRNIIVYILIHDKVNSSIKSLYILQILDQKLLSLKYVYNKIKLIHADKVINPNTNVICQDDSTATTRLSVALHESASRLTITRLRLQQQVIFCFASLGFNKWLSIAMHRLKQQVYFLFYKTRLQQQAICCYINNSLLKPISLTFRA